MRVRLESLGCRLNIGEIEELGRTFVGRGHRVVGPGEETDLVVFNSCAVTHVASRKSRKLLRQLRRRHPDAHLVATGCYAELSPDEVTAAGVDLVVDNRKKDRLPDLLEERGLLTHADPLPSRDASPYPDLPGSRTRAFVKVQDGCDNRCTFCIVTVARGESRSRSQAAVVAEVRHLAELGYREIVLSGVHLGSWGQDLPGAPHLGDLVRALLDRTSIGRVRLSSLEPWDLDADFFELWANERLLPHLHLPLQSGCDRTLERMARRTSQREFSALLEAARERIPDLAVTSDVIVGFPGEDDAEFEDSVAFIERLGLAGLHVFRYSPREGTAAARMTGRVDPEVARERSARLHRLADAQAAAYRKRFVGRRLDVLWETSEPWGEGLRWSGLTGNYLRVLTETRASVCLANRVLPTTIGTPTSGAVQGATAESLVPQFDLGPPGGAETHPGRPL